MMAQNVDAVRRKTFRLVDHPLTAMLLMIAIWILLILLVGNAAGWIGVPADSVYWPLFQPTLAHIVTLFIIAPWTLGLPKGKTTLRQYLEDIHLTRIRPLLPLIVLGLSTALIMLFSSAATSVAFRMFQGLRLNARFWQSLIDLRASLPPQSMGFVTAVPCIFEEVAWRGVMLTLFRQHMSDRRAIVYSALGFGFLHLFNLVDGAPLIWVLGQSIWGSALGIFYGYLVVRVESLLPAMLFHYLVNLFIASFNGYLQHVASLEMWMLFTCLGTVMTVPLLIGWTRFYSACCLPAKKQKSMQPESIRPLA